MRSTSEIDKTGPKADAVLDVYRRLSSRGQLLAPRVAFSFDRELRSTKEVDDLERRALYTRVLKRRTLENYLLHSAAITAVLRSLAEEANESQISELISDRVLHYRPPESQRYGDPIDDTDAPKVLEDIFSIVSENRNPYIKTTHSPAILVHILENMPGKLSELVKYIEDLERLSHD